jgi:hypothetical protein
VPKANLYNLFEIMDKKYGQDRNSQQDNSEVMKLKKNIVDCKNCTEFLNPIFDSVRNDQKGHFNVIKIVNRDFEDFYRTLDNSEGTKTIVDQLKIIYFAIGPIFLFKNLQIW